MKDIVISAKRVKKEATILLACFTMAFIINVASIVIYKTSWLEIFTQIGYVIIITLTLYLVVAFIRLIIYLIYRLTKR
ncbi:MAG: hypothetical protein WC914_03570 [Proteiniphilum sp.]